MGSHAANELVSPQPSWPPTHGLKDRDGAPVDCDRDLLTGFHAIEQGPCVVAQLTRGNLCHATTVASVRQALREEGGWTFVFISNSKTSHDAPRLTLAVGQI